MNLPAMPGGTGGGGATAGMSDQEAAMVKAVSQNLNNTHSQDVADRLLIIDARSYGELSFQDCHFGRNGFCSRRSFWPVYVERA